MPYNNISIELSTVEITINPILLDFAKTKVVECWQTEVAIKMSASIKPRDN